MGRFRRKRSKAYVSQGSHSNTKNNDGSVTISPKTNGADNSNRAPATGDRKFLVKYLREYQKGAFCHVRGEPLPSSFDTDAEKSTIFDHKLPILNADTLRQPYLEFPTGFSHKQRKTVHEVCTDLGIYHTSVGRQKVDRCVVCSIYRDGFEYLPDFAGKEHQKKMQQNSQTFSILSQLKPWALRRPNNNPSDNITEVAIDPEEATKRGREAVYRFVDQPGECLRDGIDLLDFQSMESQDLSQTTPPSFVPDDWMLVDSPEKMEQCVKELEESRTTEIAFDLECYNKSKYLQVTCLIQLAASNGKEYVIDPLAPGVWDSVNLLVPLFADPTIVKIGHSIGGLDVRSLHRDFGIFVVNAFDTYEAAACLSLPRKGLAKVCDYYGLPNCSIYETLKQEYQTTDWTRRPLTEAMIRYGRYDVHYLIQLWELMMRDLAKAQLWEKEIRDTEAQQVKNSIVTMLNSFDEDEEAFVEALPDDEQGFQTPTDDIYTYHDAVEEECIMEAKEERQSLFHAHELRMNLDLMHAISRSQDRCLDLWTENVEPALKNSDFQSLLVRSKSEGVDWTPSQFQLYEDLAQWREKLAKQHECAATFVCSLGFLATAAFKRPTNKFSLMRISVDLPGMLQSTAGCLNEFFALIRQSRIEDGLDDYEDLSLFPSFKESTTKPSWSAIFGLVSCAALVVLASQSRNRRLRR
jgi:ribonuclease D